MYFQYNNIISILDSRYNLYSKMEGSMNLICLDTKKKENNYNLEHTYTLLYLYNMTI